MEDSSASDVLVVRTLGRTSATRHSGSGSRTLSLGDKQFALLTYLACDAQRAVRRRELISLLWDSASVGADERSSSEHASPLKDQAANADVRKAHRADDAFRNALEQLRIKVGRDAFGPPRGDPVRLAVPIDLDRDTLLAADTQREPHVVVQLYEGAFLPRFEFLAAPAAFRMWLEGERETLRRTFLRAARQLTARAPNDSTSVEQLATLGQRLLATTESDDDTWLSLLRALEERSEVAHLRSLARQALRATSEHAIELSPELMSRLASAAALSASDGKQRPQSDARERFVGRERELAIILSAWQEAYSGTFAHVHLTSPAGGGKTALLEHARLTLRALTGDARAKRIVQRRALPGVLHVPFAYAASVTQSLGAQPGAIAIESAHADALVTLAPALAETFRIAKPLAGSLATHRARLTSALRALLAAVAAEGPLLLLLDDLHWSDAESLALLADVLRQPLPTPVLLLSASRGEAALLGEVTGGKTVMLPPLTSAEIRDLLESIRRLPKTHWARDLPWLLAGVSDGLPHKVIEHVTSLEERALLIRGPSGWQTRDAAGLLAALDAREVVGDRLTQLDAESREVLLWLAVCGAPLSLEQLSTIAGWSTKRLGTILERLRERGFVERDLRGWTPRHDLHASAILELASQQSRAVSSAAVGSALAQSVMDGADDRPMSADDVRQLQHAVSRIVAGNDATRVASIFTHVVQRARASRDWRSNTRLAQELLRSVPDNPGNTEKSAQDSANLTLPPRETGRATISSEGLVHALPWRLRYWRALRLTTGGALVAGLMATSAAVALHFRPPASVVVPEEVLMIGKYLPTAGRLAFYQLPILTPNGSSIPIHVSVSGSAVMELPTISVTNVLQTRPDGHAWLVERDAHDSGGLEVTMFTDAGEERRLTTSRGDDVSPTWAPDGKQLVFSTMRFNAKVQYNLAVLDTATGAVRQLTSGDDRDVQAMWSPDGSRIVFERQYWTGGLGLCVIDADGAALVCKARNAHDQFRLHGWLNATDVLLERRRTGADSSAWQLVRWSVGAANDEVIDPALTDQRDLRLSADGRWVVCRCAYRDLSAGTWSVFPVAHPSERRAVIVSDADTNGVVMVWQRSPSSTGTLASRLQIMKGPGDPSVGVPYVMRAQGLDSADKQVALGAVRWSSRTPDVATIDADGTLHPSRTGRALVIASAGGWRVDSLALEVRAPNDSILLDETWSRGLTRAWTTFGQPRPRVVDDARFGHAFFNNGDREYFSGAYSADSFDVRGGLWVSAQISTPITSASLLQEQLLTLLAPNTEALKHFDHVHGDMTPGDCRIYVPWGDGASHGDSLFIVGPLPGARLGAPAKLRSGAPMQFVVQVFPDGRCGFALGDRELWTSPPAFFSRWARVKLDGRSVGTRVLVGEMRVGRGVMRGVRWLGVEGQRGTVLPRRD